MVKPNTSLTYPAVGITEQTLDTITFAGSANDAKSQALIRRFLKPNRKDIRTPASDSTTTPAQRLNKARALARSRGAV